MSSHDRPEVGQAVYVPKPYLSASKGGRVVGVIPAAREVEITHDSGHIYWYDFDEVTVLAPVVEPKTVTPSESALRHVADQAASYTRAFLAEPEGADEHLDMIERRLATARLDATSRRVAEVYVTGLVTRQSHRVAFVPKGGA